MSRQTNTPPTGCMNRLANMLTVLILFLAGLTAVVIGITFFAPNLVPNNPLVPLLNPTPLPTDPPPTLLSLAVVPTATETPTPELQPTWTTIPDLPTATQPPTNTPRPTSTPTAIPTFPTRQPSPTITDTPTNTPTSTPLGPTATPTPTRASAPFTRSDVSPFYLQNQANSAGCDWMGVAGEVLNIDRNPVPVGSYRVHVWGNGLDERVVVGGAPAYSPAGWEQFLFNAPTVRTYNLQLETPSGTPVSEIYTFTTRASCEENLIRFDFVQNY